jgi:hypothetical protein
MDDAVLGDVMRLMKSADVQRMVSEMQASVSPETTADGLPANLDQMISNMARGVLRTMAPGGGDGGIGGLFGGGAAPAAGRGMRHSLAVSITDAHAGKTRKLRAKRRAADGKIESRDLRVVVPAGCTDGHEVTFEGEGDYDERSRSFGSVVVCVSVAKKEGIWTRCGANLFTTQRVSLSDAQGLRLVLTLPWGERRVVEAGGERPLVGWHRAVGAGLGASGDAYVNLKLELPDAWNGVPDLRAFIPSLLEAEGDGGGEGLVPAELVRATPEEEALAASV